MSARIVQAPGNSGLRLAEDTTTMVNKSGGTLNPGDLVYADEAVVDDKFDVYTVKKATLTSTELDDWGMVGVVVGNSAADDKDVRVQWSGRVIVHAPGATLGVPLAVEATAGHAQAAAAGNTVYGIARSAAADASTNGLKTDHVYADWNGLCGGFGTHP